MNRVLVFLLLLLTVSVAFGQAAAPAPANSPKFDVNNMDRSVDPCVDFYKYACGGWMAKNPIPPDQTRWGQFNELTENNMAVLRTILDQDAKLGAKRSPVQQKIGDMYASCMDEATVNKLGAQPIQPLLKRIDAVKTDKDVIDTMAYLHGQGIR